MKYNKKTMIVTLVFTIIITITINILHHYVPEKVPYLFAAIFNVVLGYIINDFQKEYCAIDPPLVSWIVKFEMPGSTSLLQRTFKAKTAQGAKAQWLSQGYGGHILISITKK